MAKRDERTPLRIYLREMGKEELLTRDREIELGKIVMETTGTVENQNTCSGI